MNRSRTPSDRLDAQFELVTPAVIASEAKQSRLTIPMLDCFVAPLGLLAMTTLGLLNRTNHFNTAAIRPSPAVAVLIWRADFRFLSRASAD